MKKKKMVVILMAAVVIVVTGVWLCGVHQRNAFFAELSIMDAEEQPSGKKNLYDFSLKNDVTDLKITFTGCEVYSGEVEIKIEDDAGSVYCAIDGSQQSALSVVWTGALKEGNYHFVAYYTEDVKFAMYITVEEFLRGYQFFL